MKKAIGVAFIVVGIISLVLPFTPGLLLIAIGLQLLGVNIILLDRIEKRLRDIRFRRRPKLS